jgi:hypothetical protein
MNDYRIGKYKFNRRKTQVIGALVILAVIVMGGAFRQASYTVENPVPSVITITGDADTATQVIADTLLTVHATVDEELYNKYTSGVFTPVARLISSGSTIAASINLGADPGITMAISGSLDVIGVPEGIYTVQIVFDVTEAGEISDAIAGIVIEHAGSPGVTATLFVSGNDPRVGIIDIEVSVNVYPTHWVDRILIKDSDGIDVISEWGVYGSGRVLLVSFDTANYATGHYVVIGEMYEVNLEDGSNTLIASDSETITTDNVGPTNELITNIYVKLESGEYSAWPVVKDGTGVLFGTILVEGIVTGDTPTSVYFVIELNGQELNRFVMSVTAVGNYAVEFDTTTLADGNYDMLVEANFADGSSIQMSAWSFGVVPGGDGADISNFIMIGLIGLVVVIFVYGFKKREMLYT